MGEKAGTLARLFAVFFKIGAFTFGGGYAMIPLIQKEVVERQKWITDDDILTVVAIAESTPGPLAINAATFVGSRVGGVAGALAATLGTVLPSFTIIFAVSTALRQFESLPVVQYAFTGIRAGVLALILKALFTMYRQTKKDAAACLIMGAAFVCTAFLKVPFLAVIAGCAAAGLLAALWAERGARR